MFYKFNSLTGRLSAASQGAAYAPQGLNPTVAESGPVTFDSSRTRPAQAPEFSMQAGAVAETANPKGLIPSSAGYTKVANFQKIWGTSSGMVWQKRGGRDSIPYIVTMGIILLATGVTFQTMYTMSFPRKED